MERCTVKELAGSGCLYVRLTRDVGLEHVVSTNEDEDEFPVTCLGHNPASSDDSSDPQAPCSSHSLAPSFFGSSSTTSSHGQSQLQDVEVESGDNGLADEGSNHGDNTAKMVEMFPHLSEDRLKYLVDPVHFMCH